MKVVFLCTSSLDNPSPRGRWFPIARELVRRGHEAHLLMLHPTSDRLHRRYFEQEGVHIAYVGQMHVYGYPGRRRYFGALRLLSIALQSAVALATHAARLQPDVIHVAKPQPINGLAGLLARRKGTRLYVDCDDYEAEANRFSGRWQQEGVRWWEDHLPAAARAVSVNTTFLYDRYRSLGVADEQLFYIPNGISAWQCRRPPEIHLHALHAALGLAGHPTIIYLGTMSTVAHGVGLLLDAFALLLARLPAARLVMVGDGDDRPALQSQARQLGIAPAVRWIGDVPATAARAYLALADCSVDPVYDTPAARGRSPLKIVESLAVGVPVVTGDVGDRREVLADGAAGLLVRPGDAAALAGGLECLLADRSLRDALAEGARRRAADYRWEELSHRWMAIYQRG